MAKKKRYVNKKLAMIVSELNCCLSEFGTATNFSGGVQAHHLLKPWDGSRGMSMRASDKNLIPLCYRHHAELHDQLGTEANLFDKYGLATHFGQMLAEDIYNEFADD